MEKTIILIQELIDAYAQDGHPIRTFSYKGLNIIDDNFSEIIREIENETFANMDHSENEEENEKISFYTSEQDRPEDDSKYRAGNWEIDENQALTRLKSGQKIETYCGNEYSNIFWIKSGFTKDNQFFISISDI